MSSTNVEPRKKMFSNEIQPKRNMIYEHGIQIGMRMDWRKNVTGQTTTVSIRRWRGGANGVKPFSKFGPFHRAVLWVACAMFLTFPLNFRRLILKMSGMTSCLHITVFNRLCKAVVCRASDMHARTLTLKHTI